MKFAIFMGCKIPYYLKDYGKSTKAVLTKLGVKTKELKFNCCGYPNRDISYFSYILSCARNLAMAENKKLDILTPCKCCFGNLKHALHDINKDETLKNEINSELNKEDLKLNGNIQIKHLLSVFDQDVGIDKIKSMVKIPVKVKAAAHYGCHALRPSEIMEFDDPYTPTIFENLIHAIGGETIEWSKRLECCGNPLYGKNDELSLKMTENKIIDARNSGADCLCTACTYCQIQFDQVQHEHLNKKENFELLPSVLYTQLLAYSMGLPEKIHGLNRNIVKHKLAGNITG